MPQTKLQTIYEWKKQGLIYDDYNELYEVYIKTMQCQHCNREFKNNSDRCMDHVHDTGKFRKIVCRLCNTHDSYIKYPNGYDKQQYDLNNKEKRFKHCSKKITCICSDIISKGWMSEHKKRQRHINNMDIYMNNVD